MIRKMGLFVLVAGWVSTVSAVEIGVVNMERLIQEHPRTARDREVLEQYVADFDVDRDERLEALRGLSEAFESLRRQAEDIGLSPDAARERRQRAQLKFEELRQAEAGLREMAAQRQVELSNQERRMRDRVIGDLRRILQQVAEEKGLDMILDGGPDPAGGYGAVVYTREGHELTDAVILKLREPKAEPES